jgi:hypothetical protein
MKKKALIGLALAVATVLAVGSGAAAGTLPYGEITSPGVDEVIFGSANFGAVYYDDDPGAVDWAVRYGTCAAATNTVFGNVDGFHDTYSWDGHLFHATADTSGWTPGHYCFVFNPREEAGETNIRLTRWFYVVDGYVSGGGQLIEEQDGLKRKDWNVISFGGSAASAGASGFIGQWQINFHNVGTDEYDKATFHTTSIYDMNFYHDGCIAMNFHATGVLNGTPGYRIIFRAQDAGEPGSLDNVRIQLFDGTGEIYDTDPLEFTAESDCFGTHRTMLDNGNLQMAAR